MLSVYRILQIIQGGKVSQLYCETNSQLGGSLVWPKPNAQAILLESFTVTDQSTNTMKLFHLE